MTLKYIMTCILSDGLLTSPLYQQIKKRILVGQTDIFLSLCEMYLIFAEFTGRAD